MDGHEHKIALIKKPPGRYGNVLFIVDQLFKSMGINSGEMVLIQVGLIRVAAKVYPASTGKIQENRFYLGVYDDKSRFPVNCRLGFIFDKGQKLFRVGPIIGIFTYRDEQHQLNPGLPFGAQTGSFKSLILTGARLNALVFVFTPSDIDWETRTIKGKTYLGEKGKGIWETRNFPLPDVVYDRIPTRTDEGRPEVQDAKERLQEIRYINYFNPQFLNKWITYNALMEDELMARYIPDTALYEDFTSVALMLKRHGRVFLKPTASSIGKGIMEILWVKGGFQCRFRQSQSNVSKVIRSSKELKDLVDSLVGRRSYLVQQGIVLAHYQERPFDVRALVQKTVDGSWVVTGMAARVAGPGSITTHVPNGGTAEALDKVIKEVFDQELTEDRGIGRELRKAALLAPPLIESYLQKNFAELSMDIGIDQGGRVWIIEVNSKPFRFDEKVIRLQSWVTIINYAKRVAGFGEEINPVQKARRRR
ncbi:MAG: YheC/YheD family protein [Clostridia bacterium]|nr:YheC/YheD family protein [Clostridia bacterium]